MVQVIYYKIYLQHNLLQICGLRTLQLVVVEAPNLGDLTVDLTANPKLLLLVDGHIPLKIIEHMNIIKKNTIYIENTLTFPCSKRSFRKYFWPKMTMICGNLNCKKRSLNQCCFWTEILSLCRDPFPLLVNNNNILKIV